MNIVLSKPLDECDLDETRVQVLNRIAEELHQLNQYAEALYWIAKTKDKRETRKEYFKE